MKDHIGSLLDAYLDNELSPSRVGIIEEHLARCELCLSELKQRRQLVALLKEAPPVQAVRSGEQFVANIHLQLTPRQNNTWTRQRVLKLGWQAVPVGLLLTIVFIQTVSFLADVTLLIPGGMDMLLNSLHHLPVKLSLGEPLQMIFGLLGVFRISDWTWITGIAATFIISITYIAWMVIWWVQHQFTEIHQIAI